jgi:hypothetical protein
VTLCLCGEEKINYNEVKKGIRKWRAPLIPRRGKSLGERGAINKID